MNQSGEININGDGNAVGDNNRILVDKRIFNSIIHRPPPNGPGRPGADESSGEGVNAIGLAIFVMIGMAVAAWQFAAHADVIYLAGIVLSLLLVGAQFITLSAGLWRGIPSTWLLDRVLGLIAGTAVFLAFYWSREAFPTELSQIAINAAGWQGFMCNLSDYGQQVATIHPLSISLLAVPGLLLAAINSVSALSAVVFFSTGWRWAGYIAIVSGGRRLLLFALVLTLAAAASQSTAAFELWKNNVFTSNQNPFSTTTKGFKLCRFAPT